MLGMFWLVLGPFCHMCWAKVRIEIRSVFNDFLVEFDHTFLYILASETYPGGTRTGKCRPSMVNNPPMKGKLFRSGGCPGTPKITPRRFLKIQ